MAVTYGFYNSSNGDRKYNALQFSRLFEGIIRDGVFSTVGGSLMVVAASNLTVNISSGRAWFNNTWTNNDAMLPLTLDPAEAILNRYDAIVLEVAPDERENRFKIVKGVPATTPIKPVMIKTGGIYQYPLAYIYVGKGVGSISQANISNAVGTTECPFITGAMQQVTTNAIVAQWESEFNTWFDDLQAQLEGNVVTNLQNQINTKLTASGGNGKDVVVSFSEAATEAHIASGEKLSVMFGKILKMFKRTQPISLGGTGQTTAANVIKTFGNGYGTCTTAAGTAAKVVTLTGFTLVVGGIIGVRFTHANTHASPTLNVNGTGAKPIRYDNVAITQNMIRSNMLAVFKYDGVAWNLINPAHDLTVVTIAATSNFTVPKDVFELNLLVIDGGGGGGGGGQGFFKSTSDYQAGDGAKGGSGGRVRSMKLIVQPGQIIPIVIGAGGNGAVGQQGSVSNVVPPTPGGISSVGTVTDAMYTTYLNTVAGPNGGDGSANYNTNTGKPGEDSIVKEVPGYMGSPVYISSGASGGGGYGVTNSYGAGGVGLNGAGSGGRGGARGAIGVNGANATSPGAGGGGSGGSGCPTSNGKTPNTSVGGNGYKGIVYISYWR